MGILSSFHFVVKTRIFFNVTASGACIQSRITSVLGTFISSQILRKCAICLLHSVTKLFLLLLIIVQIFHLQKYDLL
jgi:hypothetical protein